MGLYKKPIQTGPVRLRMPRNEELIGEIVELLGASRFRIECKDGTNRMCRIPGKMRKRLKLRAGDWVLIKPWSIEPEKGDIVWIYTRTQASLMQKKGMI